MANGCILSNKDKEVIAYIDTEIALSGARIKILDEEKEKLKKEVEETNKKLILLL